MSARGPRLHAFVGGKCKVESSTIFSIVFIVTILVFSFYYSTEPNTVFSQLDDNDEDENISNSHQDTTTPAATKQDESDNTQDDRKFVILTFDDGYKSQYTNAKPILDKYGFKATFYVVCNYAQKIDVDRMNWAEVKELYSEGNDMGSHTMNHQDLTQIPPHRLEYEIGTSKQCLLGNGISNVTSFAYPFAEGSTNPTIINTVAKYYPIARTADAPLMFLDCRGWNNDNEDSSDDISSTINASTTQTDCREYSDDGRLNLVNRYTIRGWAHDSERAANLFSDEYMLHRFKEIVDSQTKYNVDDKIKAIPIIIWHNIANNVEDDPYTTTSVELFEAEIKYLHDNGFTILTMSDLLYDKNSNSLKINMG
jgi:peptidoglycan/xylan/chitin deacetylase (PgdA/CDA1 family)